MKTTGWCLTDYGPGWNVPPSPTWHLPPSPKGNGALVRPENPILPANSQQCTSKSSRAGARLPAGGSPTLVPCGSPVLVPLPLRVLHPPGAFAGENLRVKARRRTATGSTTSSPPWSARYSPVLVPVNPPEVVAPVQWEECEWDLEPLELPEARADELRVHPVHQALHQARTAVCAWKYRLQSAVTDASTRPLAQQTHLNVHLLGESFQLETDEQEERFAAWWGSIIRCTYREGFLPMYRRVEGTEDHIKITSDAGWGCMIRVGQMLLIRALMRHHGIEPGDDLEADVLTMTSPSGVSMGQLLELFFDDPNFSRCPLSLYAFVNAAGGGEPWVQLYDSGAPKFSSEELYGVPQKRPGDWFGPCSVSLTAQRLLSRGLPLADFSVVVETDGEVYVDEVERASQGWTRNVLLLLALKLGHGEVAPAAREGILRCLELPSSLGVLGGRPRRAHFFVGKCDNGELLYLDPHRVQTAATDSASLATFRNADAPPLLPVQGIDSSVSCAFFLRSTSDLETLIAVLPETPFAIATGPRPKWSVAPVDSVQPEDPFVLL